VIYSTLEGGNEQGSACRLRDLFRLSRPYPALVRVPGKKTVSGVTLRPLGPCYLEWFSERPALVLACPRTDLIRLWPLPVEYPWFEEAWPPKSLAQRCE
jgi:hypothetical protein